MTTMIKTWLVGMLLLASQVPAASAAPLIATAVAVGDHDKQIDRPNEVLEAAAQQPWDGAPGDGPDLSSEKKQLPQRFAERGAGRYGFAVGSAIGSAVGFAVLGPAGAVLGAALLGVAGEVLFECAASILFNPRPGPFIPQMNSPFP